MHLAVTGDWPDEAAPLQAFGEEAQSVTVSPQLPLPRARHRALLLIHLLFQFALHERPDVLQQMVARFPAAYVDVAVVCVAAEAVSTMALNCCAIACWISLSTTVGMPKVLTPPSGFGISIRRIARGW